MPRDWRAYHAERALKLVRAKQNARAGLEEARARRCVRCGAAGAWFGFARPLWRGPDTLWACLNCAGPVEAAIRLGQDRARIAQDGALAAPGWQTTAQAAGGS